MYLKKYIVILTLIFVALSYAQEASLSDEIAREQENTKSYDQLESEREAIQTRLDSLTDKRKQLITVISSRLDEFIDKEMQENKEVIDYKKKDLIMNLVYRLGYYYHGVEETEEAKTDRVLSDIWIEYLNRTENGDETATGWYLTELSKVAPSLLNTYTNETLLSVSPDFLYTGNYNNSIKYYTRVIREYPSSDAAASALYNLGYIQYSNTMQKENAVEIYKELISRFPESQYYDEANFLIGEYYFDPALNPQRNPVLDSINIGQAINYYDAIVEKNEEDDFYYKALYRLGFSYYRIYKYDIAAKYMTRVIEEMYDKFGTEETFTDMRELSRIYLAFTFKDRPWLNENGDNVEDSSIVELKNYILARKDENLNALYIYGDKIFENLGEAFYLEEKYDHAIAAYDTLLSMYPLIERAPRIQEKIIAAYKQKLYLNEEQRREDLLRERIDLFAQYKPRSQWQDVTQINRDSVGVDTLIAQNLYINIRTLQTKAQEESQGELFEETIDLIDNYVEELPPDSNTYKLKWYKAYILKDNLDKPLDAYEEFMKLVDDTETTRYYDDDSGIEFTDSLAAINAINIAQEYMRREKQNNNNE